MKRPLADTESGGICTLKEEIPAKAIRQRLPLRRLAGTRDLEPE